MGPSKEDRSIQADRENSANISAMYQKAANARSNAAAIGNSWVQMFDQADTLKSEFKAMNYNVAAQFQDVVGVAASMGKYRANAGADSIDVATRDVISGGDAQAAKTDLIGAKQGIYNSYGGGPGAAADDPSNSWFGSDQNWTAEENTRRQGEYDQALKDIETANGTIIGGDGILSKVATRAVEKTVELAQVGTSGFEGSLFDSIAFYGSTVRSAQSETLQTYEFQKDIMKANIDTIISDMYLNDKAIDLNNKIAKFEIAMETRRKASGDMWNWIGTALSAIGLGLQVAGAFDMGGAGKAGGTSGGNTAGGSK